MISQILGKYKVAAAFQEPQWADVILVITVQGFVTGLLHYGDKDYQIDVNLLRHQIELLVDNQVKFIPLSDGATIKSYYQSKTTLQAKMFNLKSI